MSPTGNSPSRKMRTLRRWNSILSSSEHRRSQSLNAVHSSPEIDATRSTVSLSTMTYGDDMQGITSNYQESRLEADVQVSPTKSVYSPSPSSASTSTPPARPRPAPRLWSEAPGYSLKGLETSVAPNHVVASRHTPNQITTSFLASPSPPSSLSPQSPKSVVSKFSNWKEKSFAGRRKGSLPDLKLSSQKYSRSFSPDSPTLPPIQSARTPSTVVTGSMTPRPISGSPALSKPPIYQELKTPEWKERDVKRASSMLLPQNLTPVVVPSFQARIPQVPPIDTRMMSRPEEERPPRPPPKSPRTLLRAFPLPKSATTTGKHTANSSITSISPIETPSTAATTWSPVSVHSAPGITTDIFGRSPPRSNDAAVSFTIPSKTTAPGFANKIIPPTLVHSRSVSNNESRLPRKSSSPALGAHARMMSESSVVHRGRPMKRGEAVVPRGPVRSVTMGLINHSFEALPQGFRQSHIGHIPAEELHGLRRDAEELASKYNILTQQQIAGLNQEQRVLDDACDQIQQTIFGLKEARRMCYASLKIHLEQPAQTLALRDHVLKQTGNLHALDSELDEWQAKLDTANERKLAIQSRIWEHLTAILTAVSHATEVGSGRVEEYTPPRSPERAVAVRRNLAEDPFQEDAVLPDIDDKTRSNVESITIWADSGVARLLRDIEEELDVIDQSRYETQV